jgi:hypothetical protein
VQRPRLQNSPAAQALPQRPQFCGSLKMLVQLPLVPQNTKPDWQRHAPDKHHCPSPQLRPQTPQFSGVELRSTQLSPHALL